MSFYISLFYASEYVNVIAALLEYFYADVQIKFEAFISRKRVINQLEFFHKNPPTFAPEPLCLK
ncbi:hypothetical protein SDC9_207423 [bioreactor metagenome]|uniref:Uncharacterized protein n=1 Tax=bioreactor metagenome TaxID=1076179 RepID=A0A645J7W0_9ZZZZ